MLVHRAQGSTVSFLPCCRELGSRHGPTTLRGPLYGRAYGNPDNPHLTRSGSLVVTTTEKESVCLGCQSSEPCLCVTGRDALVRRARVLTARGTKAAQAGHLLEAEGLLSEAVTIDRTLVHAWEARGLAAFARGDARLTRHSWRHAMQADPNSRAVEWLQSLAAGELWHVLESYNDALSQAKTGRRDDAIRALERARALCPEFEPAARLQRLLAQHSEEPARTGWSDAADARSSTLAPSVARARLAWTAGLLVATLGILAGWSQFFPRLSIPHAWRPDATLSKNGVATFVADSPRELRHTRGLVPTTSPDSLADAVRKAGIGSGNSPTSAGKRTAVLRRAAGRKHYLAGRAAFRRGDDQVAITELGRAADIGTRAYYQDDALYLRMLAQERLGDAAAARASAEAILKRFGTSIYANSRTRRLAGDVAAKGNQ